MLYLGKVKGFNIRVKSCETSFLDVNFVVLHSTLLNISSCAAQDMPGTLFIFSNEE